MTKISGIYRALCVVTGKSYVGKTVDFCSRAHGRRQAHLSAAASGKDDAPKFYRALRKYGPEAFIWEVLEEVPASAREALNERERFWIAKLDTINSGYNCLPGGEGHPLGYKASPETRAKLSEICKRRNSAKVLLDYWSTRPRAHTQETKDKIASASRRQVVSKETKEKMSQSAKARTDRHRGYRHTPEAIMAMSLAKLGKKMTHETREKMSKSHQGTKLPAEVRAKVAQSKLGRKLDPVTRKLLPLGVLPENPLFG